jgi:hypothetical protein
MKSVLVFTLLAAGMIADSKTSAQAAKATESVRPSFSITISARRDTIKLGSHCYIEVTTKNLSTHEIQIVKILGQSAFQMEVKDEEGNSMPESELAQETRRKRSADSIREASVVAERIKPGESHRDIIVVDDYYDLSKLIKFTIQLHRLDPEIQTEVRSNTVTVTVTSN